MKIDNTVNNISKIKANLKHHVLISDYHEDPDEFGNANNSCKYIDITEGRAKGITVFGDEKPIQDD